MVDPDGTFGLLHEALPSGGVTVIRYWGPTTKAGGQRPGWTDLGLSFRTSSPPRSSARLVLSLDRQLVEAGFGDDAEPGTRAAYLDHLLDVVPSAR